MVAVESDLSDVPSSPARSNSESHNAVGSNVNNVNNSDNNVNNTDTNVNNSNNNVRDTGKDNLTSTPTRFGRSGGQMQQQPQQQLLQQ